jgi:hypothetical protein
MNVSAPSLRIVNVGGRFFANPFSSHFCCVAFLMGRIFSTVYISGLVRPSH